MEYWQFSQGNEMRGSYERCQRSGSAMSNRCRRSSLLRMKEQHLSTINGSIVFLYEVFESRLQRIVM